MKESDSELQPVPCDLCGASDSEMLLRVSGRGSNENRDLVKCASCGLTFISPRKNYQVGEKNYFEDHKTLDIFKVFYDFISQWTTPPGQFLDVGCAAGYLIDIARANGWQVTGLDVSEEFVEFAKYYLKLDVRQGTLFDNRFDDKSVNVIALTEVIEHVPGPSELLAELNRILDDTGILFLSTPNIGSKAFIDRGEKWTPVIDPERHLYYFSPGTMARSLEKAGFIEVMDLTQFGPDGDECIVVVAAKAGHAGAVRRRAEMIRLSGRDRIRNAARYMRLKNHWFFGPFVRLGDSLINKREENES